MTKPDGALPAIGGRAAAFFVGLYGAVTEFTRALDDFAKQLARPSGRAAWATDFRLFPHALRWAMPWAILGRTSRDANPVRWLELHARQRPHELALADPDRRFTFAELLDEVQRIAVSLAQRGIRRNDRVAILHSSTAELVTQLLGCWYIGAIPCPLDPETPTPLLDATLEQLAPRLTIRASMGDRALDAATRDRQLPLARVPLAGADLALILATSGSEGRAKLCRLTAGRLALSGHAFGGLALQCRRGDVIYCPLPLQHATAITVGMMPALVHGVALQVGAKFSASNFWQQVHTCGATQILYVGDLWRYVLAANSPDATLQHRVRVAVGNGLDRATWHAVIERFKIPRIVEFYGATEAPSALLNFAGSAGSIGRVPLRRLSRYVVMRVGENGEIGAETPKKCGVDEPGELWIRLPRGRRPWLGEFEGYVHHRDDARPVVTNVFRAGDRYYRTGDIVRYDADDFLYFVDRIGDLWRNKGHNVSTIWLAAILRAIDGVTDACVLPVALDDSSRRFGLAIVVTPDPAAIANIEARLRQLPSYARPTFVQCVEQIAVTATFKPKKGAWRAERWSPQVDGTRCYVWNDDLQLKFMDSWLHVREAILIRS